MTTAMYQTHPRRMRLLRRTSKYAACSRSSWSRYERFTTHPEAIPVGKKEKFVYVHGVGPKELDVLLDTESVSTGQPILRFAQLSFVWSLCTPLSGSRQGEGWD